MNAPQITFIALAALGLGISMKEHGQPKTGNHNFWIHLIAVAINVAILKWGKFF